MIEFPAPVDIGSILIATDFADDFKINIRVGTSPNSSDCEYLVNVSSNTVRNIISYEVEYIFLIIAE